jgi:hypothetical protein
VLVTQEAQNTQLYCAHLTLRLKPYSLDKLSSVKSVYSHLNKTGLPPVLLQRNKTFISVMSMMSDTDEDADVTLVWDWLLHYPKCSREFWVHPMKKEQNER